MNARSGKLQESHDVQACYGTTEARRSIPHFSPSHEALADHGANHTVLLPVSHSKCNGIAAQLSSASRLNSLVLLDSTVIAPDRSRATASLNLKELLSKGGTAMQWELRFPAIASEIQQGCRDGRVGDRPGDS